MTQESCDPQVYTDRKVVLVDNIAYLELQLTIRDEGQVELYHAVIPRGTPSSQVCLMLADAMYEVARKGSREFSFTTLTTHEITGSREFSFTTYKITHQELVLLALTHSPLLTIAVASLSGVWGPDLHSGFDRVFGVRVPIGLLGDNVLAVPPGENIANPRPISHAQQALIDQCSACLTRCRELVEEMPSIPSMDTSAMQEFLRFYPLICESLSNPVNREIVPYELCNSLRDSMRVPDEFQNTHPSSSHKGGLHKVYDYKWKSWMQIIELLLYTKAITTLVNGTDNPEMSVKEIFGDGLGEERLKFALEHGSIITMLVQICFSGRQGPIDEPQLENMHIKLREILDQNEEISRALQTLKILRDMDSKLEDMVVAQSWQRHDPQYFQQHYPQYFQQHYPDSKPLDMAEVQHCQQDYPRLRDFFKYVSTLHLQTSVMPIILNPLHEEVRILEQALGLLKDLGLSNSDDRLKVAGGY